MIFYRILVHIKGLRRRWLARGNVLLQMYADPEAVGGWRGWYECRGEVIAFLGMDDKVVYVW